MTSPEFFLAIVVGVIHLVATIIDVVLAVCYVPNSLHIH